MNGILLLGRDEVIESRAKRYKVALERGNPALPFAKTLITEPGTKVPWDLLPVAWELLDRWDAAAPLWRYDVTAESCGTADERKITQKIVHDLRVLLHACELLFVRKNDSGAALVDAWVREYSDGSDKRLAFLRAFYQIKPTLCTLPTSWLAEIEYHIRSVKTPSPNIKKPLVMIELEPGRMVKCHAGDEERVYQHFRRQLAARRK